MLTKIRRKKRLLNQGRLQKDLSQQPGHLLANAEITEKTINGIQRTTVIVTSDLELLVIRNTRQGLPRVTRQLIPDRLPVLRPIAVIPCP